MRMCPGCVVGAGVLIGAAGLFGVGAMVGAGEKPVAPASTLADAFSVDGTHSFVLFRVKHNGVSHAYGRFNKVSGTFDIDPAKPDAAMIDITVAADSVDTGNAKRDQHLQSQDFFSVKEFPTLTFKSKSSKKDGDVISCTGDLTLHGVTKSVTVPVEFVGTGEGRGGSKLAGFECIFTVKRSDFGMSFMQGPLGDDVKVIVSVEGGRK